MAISPEQIRTATRELFGKPLDKLAIVFVDGYRLEWQSGPERNARKRERRARRGK